MKLGIILSVILLLAIVIISIALNHAPVDDGTSLTAPDKLVKMTLPPSLPPVFVSEHPEALANPLYQAVFDFYRENQKQLAVENPPENLSDALTKLLIEAMKAGRVTAPLFDDQIEMKPQGDAKFGDALEQVPSIVLTYAKALAERRDEAYAVQAYLSVWALGQRSFQYNTRLYPRQTGLTMMSETGDMLFPLVEKRPELASPLQVWAGTIKTIDAAWTAKDRGILAKLKPPVGDLLRLAEQDQDMSFRVEAVLMMGVAKFNPGTQGNFDGLNAAIAKFKTDPDPMISQAATVAEAFTAREVQRLGGSRRN